MSTEKRTRYLDISSKDPWSSVTVKNESTPPESKENPQEEEIKTSTEPEEGTPVEGTQTAESAEGTSEETSKEVSEEPKETSEAEVTGSESPVEGTEEPEETAIVDPDETEVNAYYYLGSQLKNDGFLPEDFELKDNVTGTEVWQAYEERLKEISEPVIRNEIYGKLREEGVNDSDLLIARAFRQGVDINMLSKSGMHERFASLKDASDEEKINSIQAMYRSREFKDTEIENQIAIAKENGSIEDLFSESTNYHASQWDAFKKSEEDRVRAEKEVEKEQQDYVENVVKKVLSNKEVKGEKFSDEDARLLREAIYTPSEIIDYEGQKYNVTALYKFNYMLNYDPEFKLWAFKKFLLKDREMEHMKNEVEKEVDDSLLKTYKAAVKKDLLSKRKREVKSKLDEEVAVQTEETPTPESRKKTYYVDFGGSKL